VIGCHRGAAIRYLRFLAALIVFGGSYNVLARDMITIAAAADPKFALGEVVAAFTQANPTDEIETIYGSSGKFHTQIRQGAPFDLFFSAEIAYPRLLEEEGLAAAERGRLVPELRPIGVHPYQGLIERPNGTPDQ